MGLTWGSCDRSFRDSSEDARPGPAEGKERTSHPCHPSSHQPCHHILCRKGLSHIPEAWVAQVLRVEVADRDKGVVHRDQG